MLAARVDLPRSWGGGGSDAVLPEGGVSPQDLGNWSGDQVEPSLPDHVSAT